MWSIIYNHKALKVKFRNKTIKDDHKRIQGAREFTKLASTHTNVNNRISISVVLVTNSYNTTLTNKKQDQE